MSSISQGLCTGCKSPGCACPGEGRLGAGIMTGHTNQVYGHGFSGTKSNVVAAQGKYAAGAALIPNQGGGDGNQSAMNTYGTNIAKGQGVNGSPLKEFPKLPMNLIKERSVGNPVGKSPHYSSNAKKVGGQAGGTGRPTANDTYSMGVSELSDGKKIKVYSQKSPNLNKGMGMGISGHSGQFASNAMSLKGGRGKKGYSHPKKGQGSRTKKGRKDFTTKKGNKYFNRRGHRQMRAQGSRKVRNPYKKSGGMGKKGYSHPKKGQGSRTKKDAKTLPLRREINISIVGDTDKRELKVAGR